MSAQLTPAKRSHDRNRKGQKGKGKSQKSAAFSSQFSPGDTIFRVLCPISKIGSVIGKSGCIIEPIRRETGAKVRVEEPLLGSNERVIIISSSEKDSGISAEGTEEVVAGEIKKENIDEVTPKEEVAAEEIKKENTDEVVPKEEVAAEEIKKETTVEVTTREEGGDADKGDASENANEDQKPALVEVSQPENKKSPAQRALLLVFEKMVVGELEKVGGNEESNKSLDMMVRLLVFTSQVGCVLGKSGSTIKQMSNDSGAQIQVLPKGDLPPSSSHDEILQISGDVDGVRSALQAVSKLLLENPPQDQDIISPKPGGPSSRSFANHHPKPKVYQERGISGPMNPPSDILTFRMICDDKRMGGVIGRGGNVVRQLQYETGCEIKIVERIAGLEDRIILISGQVHPDERISAPQDAVLRVQDKIFRAMSETQENAVPAKILINSNQIGCLLGKGGGIISEMRSSTGAYIRILGKDQLPSFASEDEEVIQINGEYGAVQDALMQITSRLREHFFRHAFPSNSAFLDQVAPFPAYGGRMEHSPPGMHSNLGPSFQGLPPREGFFNDDHVPFMHRPGMPPPISERDQPVPWGPQDYAGGPPRRNGGFGGGVHQPIITNMSVEVIVPRVCVDAIYGENGGCLKQIREFSEAKIIITDPKPGASETLIRISGTPEQTHAAQSLIQAFVMMERESS